MSIRFRPLHDDLGVEVRGIDLSHPLDDATFAVLLDAYYRHSLLLFRDQAITPDDQARFLARFGTPKIENRTEFNIPGALAIGRIGNVTDADGNFIAYFDRYNTGWHPDGIAACHVDAVTMLYAIEVPEHGGETLFASAAVAAETLPPALRARAEGVRTLNSFHAHNDRVIASDPKAARPLTPEQRAALPPVWHDLLQRHPVTGREVLYFCARTVERVEGLDTAEGEALLAELLAHMTKPERVYTHRWRPGDLVAWDNHALQHSATEPSPYLEDRRLLHRCFAYTLPTERPLADLDERNAIFARASQPPAATPTAM